jgi:hypothetical protein
LFEKRAAVYEATKDLINTIQAHGQISAEDLVEFYGGIRGAEGAEFLFDGDTRNFIMNIGEMGFRARMARLASERQLHIPTADKLIDEEEDILQFLQEQAPNLEKMFGRYLDLSKVGL